MLLSWGGHLAQSALLGPRRAAPRDGASLRSLGAPWHVRDPPARRRSATAPSIAPSSRAPSSASSHRSPWPLRRPSPSRPRRRRRPGHGIPQSCRRPRTSRMRRQVVRRRPQPPTSTLANSPDRADVEPSPGTAAVLVLISRSSSWRRPAAHRADLGRLVVTLVDGRLRSRAARLAPRRTCELTGPTHTVGSSPYHLPPGPIRRRIVEGSARSDSMRTLIADGTIVNCGRAPSDRRRPHRRRDRSPAIGREPGGRRRPPPTRPSMRPASCVSPGRHRRRTPAHGAPDRRHVRDGHRRVRDPGRRLRRDDDASSTSPSRARRRVPPRSASTPGIAKAEGNAVADYGFHMIMSDVNDGTPRRDRRAVSPRGRARTSSFVHGLSGRLLQRRRRHLPGDAADGQERRADHDARRERDGHRRRRGADRRLPARPIPSATAWRARRSSRARRPTG